MKKIKFGFIQGRMTSPPSTKILQYFPKKNWRKEFYYAKKYNFNFIEYFGERNFNKNNPVWNKKNLIEINKLAKINKLTNYSFCDDYFINNNLFNYLNFEKYYLNIVENLSIINIKIYVLALFEKSLINKKNFKNYALRLQSIADKLKNKKIKLALETNLDVESIIKLIKLINRKNVFIVYDTGNRLKKKDLQYKEIIKLKKYICHFHLKDKNHKGENVVLGTGSVDFDSIFRAIKANKYDGNYVFETNRGINPRITMRNNKNFILKKMNKFYN
jgi:sugar phosphate isomerase/epimerase